MTLARYGPGDEITWPPGVGHPNDPRTESDDRDPADLPRAELRAHLETLTRDELIGHILDLLDGLPC